MPDIELYGATYSDVPAVDLPKSGGGTARFYDPNEITFPVTSVNNQTGDVVLKTSDITNDSGYITGMYIASYGSSTYAQVLAAYQANKVVYCRASSNDNPATGDQKRLAFLAYVSDSTTPTEFEFQYYRSVATHSDSQQGDQVFVYKLNSSTGWSVTTREAYTKISPSTGLSKSYSNGTLTVSVTNPLPSVTSSDNGKLLKVANGSWEAASPTKTLECYVEPSAANYTIGGLNYLEMDYPLDLTGDEVVSIGLATWSSNSGPFSIFPYGTTLNKWYIVGAAGTTINGAKFKYWYIPSEGE